MRLREMRGLGPKTEEMLAPLGITTAEQLRASDPFDVYARVPGASLNLLYALIGAIEGQHWIDVKRERRLEILTRLEALGIAAR
jgi:DNA transformation protein